MEAEGAPGAVLETERMVLRELVPEDIDDLMLIFSDPEAMRYSTLDQVQGGGSAMDTLGHRKLRAERLRVVGVRAQGDGRVLRPVRAHAAGGGGPEGGGGRLPVREGVLGPRAGHRSRARQPGLGL